MFKFYRIVLVSILFLFCIGGVCATDPDTNITGLDNNCLVDVNCSDNNIYTLNHDNGLYASDNVTALTNNKTNNNAVTNDSSDLSDVPCAVSSYISVMESYNKSVDVETGIKETNTVNNVTSVEGLVNGFTKHGLNCNVIKNNFKDLKELHKDKKLNIIVHMFIKNNYHFGHIKEIIGEGILFNNGSFLFFNEFKNYYTNICIIITNDSSLNLSSMGKNVNKTDWSNIKGKLTEREIYNLNIGLIKRALSLNSECNKLKANLKYDSTKQYVASFENVLFGDSLKPKMANLLTIQKKLKTVTDNPNASPKLLKDLNNILTPMQESLKDTIEGLNLLKNHINNHIKHEKNLKNPPDSTVLLLKHVDVSKLLGDCGEVITENNLLNQFVKNFEDSVNNLNILNAYPELREKLDQKYGLDHNKIGFIDFYTLKKIRR